MLSKRELLKSLIGKFVCISSNNSGLSITLYADTYMKNISGHDIWKIIVEVGEDMIRCGAPKANTHSLAEGRTQYYSIDKIVSIDFIPDPYK